MMTDKELYEYCKEYESRTFEGWDFSSVKDGYSEERLPWSYRNKIYDFLKPDSCLLDIDTGGGEFLLSLRHTPELTKATEGYEANYELCKKRFGKSGIEVKFVNSAGKLPFEDNSFNVIINRHGAYNLCEVKRVLKKGGFFITQQVGGENNTELANLLVHGYKPFAPMHNLENEKERFITEGLRIMYRSQCFVNSVFTDIGALCYYVKALPWQFENFSVDRCFKEIKKIYRLIEQEGRFTTTCHRFIIIAKKA